MKWSIASKSSVVLLSIGFALSSPSLADDEIPEELQESVRTEIAGIAESIRILGRIAHELSPQRQEQYEKAKRLADEARDQAKSGRLRVAYRTLRQAKHAITPVVAEALEQQDVPQDIRDIVADEVAMTAGRIEALSRLASRVATPEAKAAYLEAKDLYDTARALHAEGKDADAIRTLDECLTRLDQAIRSTYEKVR